MEMFHHIMLSKGHQSACYTEFDHRDDKSAIYFYIASVCKWLRDIWGKIERKIQSLPIYNQYQRKVKFSDLEICSVSPYYLSSPQAMEV